MSTVTLYGLHGSIAVIGGGTATGGGSHGTAVLRSQNCTGRLDVVTHNQGLGIAFGQFRCSANFPDPTPQYDCEFGVNDAVVVKTWTLFFFSITSVLFRLQTGVHEVSCPIQLSLGLGFHRFRLLVREVTT